MSRPDQPHVRPRYGRVCALVASAGLTLGAVAMASLDLVPYSQAAQASLSAQNMSGNGGGGSPAAPAEGVDSLALTEDAERDEPAVPARSEHGRRVVFDMSEQRVWLVTAAEDVTRTYLVSGSRVDNLHAGSFEVYSRSLHAIGYTGSTTMDYMVRFTTGDQAAIGFHDIPVDSTGRPVQSRDELGTPTSAGCIRQRTADAKVMWAFARRGTRVVVID